MLHFINQIERLTGLFAVCLRKKSDSLNICLVARLSEMSFSTSLRFRADVEEVKKNLQ